jgi:aldehyde dehydrogenase (NAD+)
MNQQQFESLKERSAIFRNDSPTLRQARLKKLIVWLSKHEDDIVHALQQDFNKPRFETIISEIMPALTEAQYAYKNLPKWMKTKTVRTPLALLGHRSFVRQENKGVVLVILLGTILSNLQ